jgi:hypothetical protein
MRPPPNLRRMHAASDSTGLQPAGQLYPRRLLASFRTAPGHDAARVPHGRRSWVRCGADSNGRTIRGCAVTNSRPSRWFDAVTCGACGWRLLPLTYPRTQTRDAGGSDFGPHVKCSGCGQCYEWRGSAGWVPPATGDRAHERRHLDLEELVGHAARRRRTAEALEETIRRGDRASAP